MKIVKDNNIITSIADWKKFASPKSAQHWKDGRSAKETAKAWINAYPQPPKEINAVFSNSKHFKNMKVYKAEPEAIIAFDKHRGPRNADLALWAQDNTGEIGITIEAKADESFGVLMGDYLSKSLEALLNNPRSKRIDRAKELSLSLFGKKGKDLPRVSNLRYQLFTAVAGTIAHANSINADRAVLIIHEFRTNKTSQKLLDLNMNDLQEFCKRLADDPALVINNDKLYGPIQYPGFPLFEKHPALYIGKVVR